MCVGLIRESMCVGLIGENRCVGLIGESMCVGLIGESNCVGLIGESCHMLMYDTFVCLFITGTVRIQVDVQIQLWPTTRLTLPMSCQKNLIQKLRTLQKPTR